MRAILCLFLLLPFSDVPQGAQKTCGYRQVRAIWQDQANPVQGVRSTFDVVNLGGGVQKSVWVSLLMGNNVWYQIGYFNIGTGKNPQFVSMCFEDWKLGCPGVTLESLNPPPALEIGTVATFYLVNVGGTLWETGINDIPISRIDFGALTGWQVQLATEEGYDCKVSRFPTVHFYPAIELYRNGSWDAAPTAYANGAEWGIAGKDQNSALRDNELLMGSSIPAIDPLTAPNLWP